MRTVIVRRLVLFGVAMSLVVLASMAHSHCQLPCGIYNDQGRFDAMAEHIVTIKKSMKLITTLSDQSKPNMNQIVRWVQNKETHADELNHTVTYYFMAQRVKPTGKGNAEAYHKYVRQLTLLHEMLVYSMKARQTTDLANVDKLESLLLEFRAIYLGHVSGHVTP